MMMGIRKFLSNLARLPLIAALTSLWASEPESHQEPVILENAVIAAGGNTEDGILVLGDCSTLRNCVIYADKVIMGKASTILWSQVDGGIEMLT